MKKINDIKYLVRNKPSGRQSINFYKPGVVNDSEHVGTTVEEILKVLLDKSIEGSTFDIKEFNKHIKECLKIVQNNE